jgi:hypothetical protein
MWNRRNLADAAPVGATVPTPRLADGRLGAEVREGAGAGEAQEQVVERPPLVLIELGEHLLAQGRGHVLGSNP